MSFLSCVTILSLTISRLHHNHCTYIHNVTAYIRGGVYLLRFPAFLTYD
jgi:hypothetical protein